MSSSFDENDKPGRQSVSHIKTGSFERRLSLTKAGLFAGTRMAGHMAGSLFMRKAKREAYHREAMSRQAQKLVEDLGQLKGSVVKIGQVMALYGEHFLPVEVTEALHTLEDNTVALDWPVISQTLEQELGAQRLAALDIETKPIGSASLGQVHRATIKATREKICLKIQYPGVAQAVDTDLDAVAQLLKLARLVKVGPDFNDWLEEVRVMMHREVNYVLEAETTARFGEMLKDDPRFIVPKVYPEYCSNQVIATSYEPGYSVSSDKVSSLSQERRNHLARSALHVFLNELFVWHEIQTDPNFGNYRIRLCKEEEEGVQDKIVLLDFGAVQSYPPSFIEPVCSMIAASYRRDLQAVIDGGIALHFMQPDWPEKIKREFGEVCMAVLEPLAKERFDTPDSAYNAAGEYRWRESDLPTRIAKRAAISAISRYFKIPPKEFVFLNRKLVGVYTFISVLGAEFNGRTLLEPYVSGKA